MTEQRITPYRAMPGFEHVYLEDSYVTEIVESAEPLEFALELEVVLVEGHPLYQPPAPGEQHCYRPARLVFPKVRRVNWIERHIRPFRDANDQIDYGTSTHCMRGTVSTISRGIGGSSRSCRTGPS